MSANLRKVLAFVSVLTVLAVAWESYKWMGEATGGVWPLSNVALPVRTNSRSMPHLWDIFNTLLRPVSRGIGAELLLIVLLKAAFFTGGSAVVGFLLGSAGGFGLGVLFVRSSIAERGLMPYVVASQTVPVIAIAPILVIWGRQLGFPIWVPAALLSAYLAFFPVAINTLRGLRSPAATASELMRSYAASPSQELWKLQVPAALPYLFPALKVAATASIIGAIVGELPAGLSVGLGRAILGFASSSNPEKLFASVVIAALLGVAFVGMVVLAERIFIPPTRRLEEDLVTANATGQLSRMAS